MTTKKNKAAPTTTKANGKRWCLWEQCQLHIDQHYLELPRGIRKVRHQHEVVEGGNEAQVEEGVVSQPAPQFVQHEIAITAAFSLQILLHLNTQQSAEVIDIGVARHPDHFV